MAKHWHIIIGLWFLSAALVLSFPPESLATRGCCSWHGGVDYCDSSVGRYVCNDGTYSPSCGCTYSPKIYTPPVYIQPTATPTPLPLNVNATYELNPTTCAYTITANWGKPSDNDIYQYSVSAVKTILTQCQDPGPLTDTSETQYQFYNFRSGSYLINVRPKSVTGWNYYTYCNYIELPPVKPTLNVNTTIEEEQQYINYSSSCATSIKVNNGIGYVNAKQGKIKVNPKGNITYTLTAVSEEGEIDEKSIILTDDTPTPTPTTFMLKTEPQNHENIFIKLFHFLMRD